MVKKDSLLKQLEQASLNTTLPEFKNIIAELQWNDQGLLPAIAQDTDTKEVLMMAWMNEAALLETLSTNRVCYWSRSRKALWRKGETSGQTQSLVSMTFDCDGDTLLLEVRQEGAACHTGRRSCFYNQLSLTGATVCLPVLVDPKELYSNENHSADAQGKTDT